ncbi:MAG: L,D-transpeptidase [Gemmatimonadetes bacterium]|nr:L,D-transpeptidase [Gemmatimonadota bacterium]
MRAVALRAAVAPLLTLVGLGLGARAAVAQASVAVAASDAGTPAAAAALVDSSASSLPAPRDPAGRAAYRAALAATGLRIAVSTEERQLWLLRGDRVLFTAFVAVGSGADFEFGGRRFHFETPRGVRRVLEKRVDPVWTVPDWHYYERAAAEHLELVRLVPGRRYPLPDGTFLEVRGRQVGRVDRDGGFWPIDPGREILLDGKLYMPPVGSEQRRVPGALGPYGLVLGHGYLIHGVHEFDATSVGQAVSHGCVRMANDDLERLFQMVPVGTPVYIF